MSDLWSWTAANLTGTTEPVGRVPNCWRSGLIALKGGDLSREVDELKSRNPTLGIELIDLGTLADAFAGKWIVSVTPEVSAG